MAGQRAEAGSNGDLAGVLPVFQTPFDDRDRIDYPALEKLFDWVFANGADGVVFAMVSEILRMSSQERDEVAAAVEALHLVGQPQATVAFPAPCRASAPLGWTGTPRTRWRG